MWSGSAARNTAVVCAIAGVGCAGAFAVGAATRPASAAPDGTSLAPAVVIATSTVSVAAIGANAAIPDLRAQPKPPQSTATAAPSGPITSSGGSPAAIGAVSTAGSGPSVPSNPPTTGSGGVTHSSGGGGPSSPPSAPPPNGGGAGVSHGSI
jgi:hypothetical protein